MDEENRDEYFRSLITQPPNHSNYNQYKNESSKNTTVLESAFYQSDCEYSTDSEVSVLVSSKSNNHFTKNTVTPDQSTYPDSIQCAAVKLEKEKGNHIAVGILTADFYTTVYSNRIPFFLYQIVNNFFSRDGSNSTNLSSEIVTVDATDINYSPPIMV